MALTSVDFIMNTLSKIMRISHSSYSKVDNMLSSQVRTSFTSRGFLGLSPYTGNSSLYEVGNIILGSNPLSKIEIVSALNSFNITYHQYHFNYLNCVKKYNPKVYMGTIQSVATWWNYDDNSGLKSELRDQQKSGSWLRANKKAEINQPKNEY